jgi:hypothetical protein
MACGARLEHGIVPSMAEPRISGETTAIVSWLHRQALKGANVDATLEGLCAQFLAGGFEPRPSLGECTKGGPSG